MSSQKMSSIKILAFDKSNYVLWKNKMMLFIRMTNSFNIEILRNGPFVPMVSAVADSEGSTSTSS